MKLTLIQLIRFSHTVIEFSVSEQTLQTAFLFHIRDSKVSCVTPIPF